MTENNGQTLICGNCGKIPSAIFLSPIFLSSLFPSWRKEDERKEDERRESVKLPYIP
jgi:hypothetical protein